MTPVAAARRFEVPDAGAMRDLGAALGRVLGDGTVVLLSGPLGVGKTTMTQGLALQLGVLGPVASPSFTLIREHETGRLPGRFVHMDFYRLSGEADVRSLGVGEYVDGRNTVAVEWPERAGTALDGAVGEGVVHVAMSYLDLEQAGEETVWRAVAIAGGDDASTGMVLALEAPSRVVER